MQPLEAAKIVKNENDTKEITREENAAFTIFLTQEPKLKSFSSFAPLLLKF